MRLFFHIFGFLVITGVFCSCGEIGTDKGKTVAVEVFVRTKGGETVRLSGAKIEVLESIPAPESIRGSEIIILKPAAGFNGIVTDADGKAVLKGLLPQQFVVISDVRQIGDRKENYLWVVAASEARDGKLLLGHHNLRSEPLNNLLLLSPTTVNARDSSGNTPLHKAASVGKKEVVELLLAHGADVKARIEVDNEKDAIGDTPLHVAVSRGRTEVAELLLAHGAEINARNEFLATPLHWTDFSGSKEVVALLLAKGADVNARNRVGSTPLYRAVSVGKKDVVDLLLAHGAEINAKNEFGETPLHDAAFGGSREVVALLLAKGADVNTRNRLGETPLRKAISGKQVEIQELLRLHGSKD